MNSNDEVSVPLGSTQEEAVRRAFASVWAAELMPTHRVVCQESKSLGVPIHNAAVSACLQLWEKAACAELQIGPSGHRIPLRINWTGKPWPDAERMTLADAVTLFLEATEKEVPDHQKRALRSALRAWFDLPDQCPERVILDAAAGEPIETLRDLPSRVAAKVRSRATLGEAPSKLASNYQAVVRAALRYAASSGRVPLWFPLTGGRTVWLTYRDMIFGCPDRELTQDERSQRYTWHMFAKFGEQTHPGLDPRDYTMAQLHETLVAMVQAGKFHARGWAVWAMRRLGEVHGLGPYAAYFQQHGGNLTACGRPNAGYILAKDGSSASDGDIDKLVEVVLDNGYPAEWEEFLRWYHGYSTLSDEEIERDPARYPDRLQKRHLAHSTWVKRAGAFRAWLFQASRATGLSVEKLTPAAVFGTHYRQILSATKDWWQARAEAGEVSSGSSDGLVSIVKASGMIALALYERLVHQRGQRCQFAGPFAGLEPVATETHEESQLRKAYAHARTVLDRFEKERAASASGGQYTTIKDIRRIVQVTPHTHWIKILDAMHAEIEKRLASKRRDTNKTHRLIRDAVIHGLFISTGCRKGELCHVRLDIHYTPSHRNSGVMELRAVDRKNKKKHVVAVHTRYLPTWLMDLYLGSTRPYLMGQHRVECGKDPVRHQHLLVMNSGVAFGCAEERSNGTARNQKAFSVRKTTLGLAWKAQMQRWAAKLGLPVPMNHGEGSCHAVRGAMAAAIALSKGFEAAAHYLGDDVGTVRETYGFLDGSSIDATDLPGVSDSIAALAGRLNVPRQDSRPGRSKASAQPAAPAASALAVAALRRKMAELSEAVAMGEISSSEFNEQVGRLEAALGGLTNARSDA